MYTVTLDGLVALVAALLIVAQLAWRLWRGRVPPAMPTPEPPEAPADSPDPRSAAVRVASAPGAGGKGPRPGAPPAVAHQRAAGMPVRAAPFRGRHALRRAYVHLAVLGPCRAVQPQDPDLHGG